MADLTFFRSKLRVSKHLLDDELEDQSALQEEISEHLAKATTAMNMAKDAVDKWTATVIAEFKENKVSETLAAGLAKKDPKRLELWHCYQAAREEQEQWVGLYDAWQRRGYSIKTLADLYAAQYFSLTSISSDITPRDLLASARTYTPSNTKEHTDPTPARRRRLA